MPSLVGWPRRLLLQLPSPQDAPRLNTSDLWVSLPPKLFLPSNIYVARVRTRLSPGSSLSGRPSRWSPEVQWNSQPGNRACGERSSEEPRQWRLSLHLRLQHLPNVVIVPSHQPSVLSPLSGHSTSHTLSFMAPTVSYNVRDSHDSNISSLDPSVNNAGL